MIRLQQKMARHHLWIWLFCLQTWPEAAGRDADLSVVNGVLGESVTFPLNIQESWQVHNIVWNSKTSVAFVETGDQRTPKVTVTHKNYRGRIHVLSENYSLVISGLRMEDAGDYKADINTNTMSETITKHYHLQVYRRLGKPKITQSLMTSMNNTCNVTLTCSVEKEEQNVTYRWSPLGKAGNVLHVFQSSENQKLNYTCTAQNPVSSNSNSVSAQQLCTDHVSSFRTRRTGLLSGLAVIMVLVLVLSSVFLFILFRKRGQGSYLNTFTKSPDSDIDVASKKTIYAYVTVSRDTQSAESRIYDEIPQPKALSSKEEPANSPYSTVQYLDKMEKADTQNSKPPGTPSYEFVI
ncbi:SLAM family member 5 isoform X1 [Tupaia chinensis]|uniref:SLAM family member 5 isoform X1 n=1 Tax=Tupaia chinensis TaxID=246437 RepID=UPI0003C8FD69|nr:SLAM family member 5 isoform X1 [Tupaia chinensis]